MKFHVKMNTIRIILIALLAIEKSKGQFPCDFKNKCYTVADSRLDNNRPERERDANPDFVEEMGTRGVSSAAYLRSFISTKNDGYRKTYDGDCELQLFGVNQIASLVPKIGGPFDGEIIVENLLNGWLDCERMERPSGETGDPKTASGAPATGGKVGLLTAGGLIIDNCYMDTSYSQYNLGIGEFGILCPFGVNVSVTINGTIYNTNGLLECYAITEGSFRVNLVGSNVFYCNVMKCTRREKMKHILKVENLFGSNSYSGNDNHLCKVENGCHLLKSKIRESRSPITQDGVHGNILTRMSLDDLLKSKRLQCEGKETYGTFKVITSEEYLKGELNKKVSEMEDLKKKSDLSETKLSEVNQRMEEVELEFANVILRFKALEERNYTINNFYSHDEPDEFTTPEKPKNQTTNNGKIPESEAIIIGLGITGGFLLLISVSFFIFMLMKKRGMLESNIGPQV